MGNIVLLDELTINKIAAGEVVERPASVIKEMVENSIDAEATNINIEVRNGGISYIRITDNGKGIAADDMEIAFERHATSKIRNASDLDQVKSMGFRGEALASIAAIANVEMVSKTIDEPIGNRIVVEAGKVLSFEEMGCPIGTTITVQNLFFNTPVRYKFLKKDYTESGYIEDVVTRLALIHPNIAFKLINSGKTIIQTSGNGKLQDVIYAIYGKDIASSVLDVDYTYEEIHVTGAVGKPEIARSNRSNQLFFVNKRYIKDKTLSGAAENSFKGLLPIGKYGFLILNLEMEPSKVDVNVHPAKLEVRFEEENKVFKAVYHAIRDTLLKAELIASTEKSESEPNNTDFKEFDSVAPSKPSITDLFRKIKRETPKEENVLEDIFKNRQADVKDVQNEQVVKEESFSENKAEEKVTLQENKRMDVLNELIAMQKRLKEEAENNPNLHTNIDDIISNTNKLQESNNSLKISEDIQEVNNVQENKEEINLEEQEDNKYNIVEEEQENYEVIPELTLQEKENLEKIKEVENIEDTNEKSSEVEDNEKLEDKEEQEANKEQEKLEDTQKFTSEQINDMIEKIEKMDNVEENPEFSSMYEKIFGKLPASVQEEKKEEEEKINAYELIKDNNVSIFEEEEEYKKPTYKFIGIAFNTYIIIEIQKELYIIDQHAAHERIMYEKVKKNYYSNSNKDSQMLLLPDIITLTHKEMDILNDNKDMFEKAGFILEEFGENTVKLTGVPNICLELDTKELFLETLDEINSVARTAKQEIEEKFLATVACKSAVKAKMVLDREEVEQLMDDLLKLPNPFTCPHGRPTAIRMDQNDIEKKFARRK